MPGEMRQVVTEASLSTRASQWWAGVPFATAILVAVCSVIYGIEMVLGYDAFSQICIEPYLVLSRYQVYRVFTSVFFHASIFHVALNMLALVPIGSALERVMGSIRFLHVIVLLIASNGAIHVGLAFLAAHNPFYQYSDLSIECGIGFSGVIFALIVIETNVSGTQSRSIFGFFTVPAKLYPWALLFLFQLLMPSVSLLGHLSGILSGFAYTFGASEWALCGPSAYSAVENAPALGFFVRRPGFIVGGSSGCGTLPSFSTGRFIGGFQRLRNSWSGLQQSMALGGEPLVDERFPGRGRNLGSVHGPPPTQSPAGRGRGRNIGSVNGVSTTQSSPDARAANNSSQAGLQSQLLENETPVSGTVEMQAVRSVPPVPRRAGPILSPQVAAPGDSLPNQNQNETRALEKLVDMGFEKTTAMNALSASNGDVTLAVEFLSAEAQ